MAESSGAGLLKQKLIWVGKMKLPTREVGSKHRETQPCSWNQELCTCIRSTGSISAWMFPAKVSWGSKRWNASRMGLTFQAAVVLQVTTELSLGSLMSVTFCLIPWDLGFATVTTVDRQHSRQGPSPASQFVPVCPSWELFRHTKIEKWGRIWTGWSFQFQWPGLLPQSCEAVNLVPQKWWCREELWDINDSLNLGVCCHGRKLLCLLPLSSEAEWNVGENKKSEMS